MLVSAIVPPTGRLRKTVQVSSAVLLAVCNMAKVPVVDNSDAFIARSGAPKGYPCRDQVHPSDGGTSRLVFNPQLATGARHHQARHQQPSSLPQQREDPAQPRQRQEGIKQHHAARPTLLGPAPPGFNPYTQLASWNSRQWQRATAPQQCAADLYRPAYYDRLNTAFNRFRPSTPLTALTPRPVSPRDTSLMNCIIGHEEDITLKPINY